MLPVEDAQADAAGVRAQDAGAEMAGNGRYGPNTVGAAQVNEHSYSHLQNEYGTIEPGENPARTVDVPRRTEPGNRVRRFTRTEMEASATPDAMIERFERGVENACVPASEVTEFSYPANRRMNRLVKEAKMRSLPKRDNLLSVSRCFRREPDGGRHTKAQNSRLAGSFSPVKRMNTSRGSEFYDITKIKKLPEANGEKILQLALRAMK